MKPPPEREDPAAGGARAPGDVVAFPERGPRYEPSEGLPEPGTFGMLLFLLSLTVLFVASIVGVLIVRFRVDNWRPPEFEGLPGGLWLSTALILGASATIHLALKRVREGRQGEFRRLLHVTNGLGLAFLALQLANWLGLDASGLEAQGSLFGFSFYALTGLHALHVLGGNVQLGVVSWLASKGRYDEGSHAAVRHTAMYWHFLDAVWVVMLALILFVL